MRTSLLVTVILLAGCATSAPPSSTQEAKDKEELGRRVETICTLPDAEREAELEKLKRESGLVLYCGSPK